MGPPMRPLASRVATVVGDWAHVIVRQLQAAVSRHRADAFHRAPAGGSASCASASVVLLPGIWEPHRYLRPLAASLHRAGHPVHPLESLGWNSADLDASAERVLDYLVRRDLRGAVLVAHSKGGLIGKHLLAHHNKGTVIRGLVAVNTPFTGSELARLLPLPTIRVFLPHSPELTALTTRREVNQHIVSVYGLFDPHIPGGSHLEGARNVQLGTRGHFLPLSDPRVHEAILEGIGTLTR